MSYEFLADVIVVIHFLYVGYVFFGQLAILAGIALGWQWIRNPWFRWSHLIMIGIVAGEALVEFECPLTTWENHLREVIWARNMTGTIGLLGSPMGQGPFLAAPLVWKTSSPRWSNTFIGDWLDHVVFSLPANLLNYIYIGFTLLVLATFILAPPRLRKRPAPAEAKQPAKIT